MSEEGKNTTKLSINLKTGHMEVEVSMNPVSLIREVINSFKSEDRKINKAGPSDWDSTFSTKQGERVQYLPKSE